MTGSPPEYSIAPDLLDIWIGPSPENRSAVIAALRVFGAPSRVVDLLRNATPTEFVVFGFPPQRIDLLQWIPGIEDSMSLTNVASSSMFEASRSG